MPYLDSESPRDIIIKRSLCALVLFKAFRAATDLVADPSNGEVWVQAYYRWVPTRTSFTREIMANMDDYYMAANQAKERGEEAVAEVSVAELDCNANNEGITGTRADVAASLDSIAMDEAVHTGADRNDDFFNLSSDDNDGAVTNDDSYADATSLDNEPSLPVFPNSRFESAVSSCAYQTLLGGAAQSTVGTMVDMRNRCQTLDFTIAELQKFASDAERLQSHQSCDERSTEVIELIASALESNCVWSPPQATPDNRPLQPYASIIQVSTAFTLNQRQHQAFTIITTSLLRRFLHQELGDGGGYRTDNFEARFRDDQLLMYLGGPGGTGKSRVIDAVNAFALAGIAMNRSSRRRSQHAIKKEVFAPLDLLVIDEVSMMRKAEWLKIDKMMRRYKQILGVPFGGVHMVLVGDFLQMPPVNADPIYIDPVEKSRPSTTDIEGFELWRNFTTVSILEEWVRFRNDPAWGDGCRNARLGQWTPELIDLINSRVLHHGSQLALQNDIGDAAVFVTPENVTRLAINTAFVAETAAMLPSGIFPIRVVANFKGALNGLSQIDLRYIMSLPDNRFGRMTPYLGLIDGMPIQVTQNVATAKGVANDTLGTLEFVHFPDDTRFRLVRDGASSTVVQLPNRPPDYAVLRLQRPHATAIRPDLDPELFPVFFATEPYVK